ncbi:MAG TPA: thioredoxin domain-containing protein [Gemmatimonadaceae bacterium]|nr:thioredoxin domain-containing protein [Gemmatimonadaceae bacterium]
MSPGLRKAVDRDDHSAGPEDAPITLVEYGDFECPYCGQAYPIVKAVQKKLGDRLRFVFRNFPISGSHPHAEHAAEASEAAAAQDHYWEMHDTLFENQTALEHQDLIEYAERIGLDVNEYRIDLESGVYATDVEEDFSSGVRSGVNGTPTFFVNGERFDGDWTDSASFARALLHV